MNKRIKKYLIVATLGFMFVATIVAPQSVKAAGGTTGDELTASKAFVEMPVKTLDLLSRSVRLDMLDYYDADSLYWAPNAMEGLSRLDTVSPRYLKVTLTPVSTLALQVLPGGKSGIVASVYTVGDSVQAKDSDIRFYDASMQELPRNKFFSLPRVSDFFKCKDKKELAEIEALVPFPTIEYTLLPSANTMEARLTVGEFMSSEDYAKVKRCLKEHITYGWTGKKYKLLD